MGGEIGKRCKSIKKKILSQDRFKDNNLQLGHAPRGYVD